MKSEEVFYLHVDGTQRGPYSIRHIDHLLNSGLITQDALFLREGMEQWLPVTELVNIRKPANRWRWLFYAGPLLVVLLLLLAFFGPTVRDGWREIFQHDFTAKAAYWRARDIVRTGAVPQGYLVSFAPFSAAEVRLRMGEETVVLLRGTLSGQKTEPRGQVWKVRLWFDPERREWSGLESVALELGSDASDCCG
jgi:hypothetical protein